MKRHTRFPNIGTTQRYALVGFVCTVASYATLFMAVQVFRLVDFLANAAAFSVGLCLSYLLNSRYSFRYTGPHSQGMLRFGIAFLIAYAGNLLILYALRAGLGLSSMVSQACAFTSFTVLFYALNRYWAFAKVRP